MNTAAEETAQEEVAINKMAKKRNTETIFLRANRNDLIDCIQTRTLEKPRFLFKYWVTKRVKSKNC